MTRTATWVEVLVLCNVLSN